MKFEPSKIEERRREKILSDFYKAVTIIDNYKEAKLFFRDLLTSKETMMLARRLQVATMLIYNFTYQEIQDVLKVGFSTIADVQKWLSLGGKGYRTIIERLIETESVANKRKKALSDSFSLESIKKRYTMYYWPEKLVDNFVDKIAKSKKKKSITKTKES